VTPDAAAILGQAEQQHDQYLSDLRKLVNVDCGTYLTAGVNQIADSMSTSLEAGGWSVERVGGGATQAGVQLGDALIAKLQGRGHGRILLVGHMDTVFPEGTAAERPFRIEGTTAYGPGVSDMKGGLLAGLYAVSCLQALGFDDFQEITYVCNPDEEIGSPFSGPLILREAKDADVCFVLEGARENGDIVSSRKGVKDLRIVVNGRAAHAGVEPERGRSATLQAAHTTIALHALNGRWPGVTVNVGVIHGGTRPNIVCDRCELQIDVRAVTADTFRGALAEVERVARVTTVPDTTVEIEAASGFPPMEMTEATARLVARAVAIASELGFEVKDTATGGASDANPVSGMGVPTLDGLGPIGGADHAPGEWLDLTSVAPRIALLAGLIASGPLAETH
jgi:glutamate carboxypeptidase